MEPVRPPQTPARMPWLVMAIMALFALVAAACGSSPPSSGGEGAGRAGAGENGEGIELPDCPLDDLEAAEGPVEVELWYGGLGGETQTTMEQMAVRFSDSQDQIQVTTNNQGGSYEEVLRTYESAANNPDQLPQIIYLEDTSLGQMVDRGQVLPAEACMEADGYDKSQLIPAALATGSVDGVLYPGYMNVSTPVLYYNNEIFAGAGLDPGNPPETLEELAEAAQAIKDAGLADKPLSFNASRWYFENWLNGAGIDYVNNDNGRSAPPTEATFNTPEALEILETLDQMNKDGLLNAFPVTEGSIDHFLALIPPAVGNPASAMLLETSTASTTIASVVEGQLTAADAGDVDVDIDIDVGALEDADLLVSSAAFPGLREAGQINSGGGGFYILNSASPEQQAAAWKYLRFMLEPEQVMEWHTVGGYLPIIDSVMDEPELETYWTETLAGRIVKPAVDQISSAGEDQAAPLMGPFIPVQDEVQGMMERILLNGADPAAELERAEEAVTGILEDYNR